jgi:hypothetical protein
MTDPKLQEYMDQTVVSFSAAQNKIADALYKIFCELYGDTSAQRVQLLALRRYVDKGGSAVAKGWAWTDADRIEHQVEIGAMRAAANKTAINFAKQNSGLSLGQTPIRSLPRQVHLWCTNETVFRASAHLLPRALRELAKPSYPEIPTSSGPIKQFKQFLKDYNPVPRVTSAAPDTSDHGQDRAVDFTVIKNGVTVAGISTARDRKTKRLELHLIGKRPATPKL